MTCYLLLYQRSMATAFDKLSYSYRTSIAKYFDLVVTIEIYIYWPNIFFIFCAHMRKYCSSQQGKPLAGASARGLGGLWPRSPLHLAAQFTLRPAECPRMRRSRFLGDKGHYLTVPLNGTLGHSLAVCDTDRCRSLFWTPPASPPAPNEW